MFALADNIKTNKRQNSLSIVSLNILFYLLFYAYFCRLNVFQKNIILYRLEVNFMEK